MGALRRRSATMRTTNEFARRGWIVVVLALCAAVFAAYLTQAALPVAAFGLPGESRATVKTIMPEWRGPEN